MSRGTAAGPSTAGRAAVERWRRDQAALYGSLERRVRGGEIKTADELRKFFAFARTKVEPNAAGPLGAELGRIAAGDMFQKERIAAAAARLKAEFDQ